MVAGFIGAVKSCKIGAFIASIAKAVTSSWLSPERQARAEEYRQRWAKRRADKEVKATSNKAKRQAAAAEAQKKQQEADKKGKKRPGKKRKPRKDHPRSEPSPFLSFAIPSKLLRAAHMLNKLIMEVPTGITALLDWLAKLPDKVITAAAHTALTVATDMAKDLHEVFGTGNLVPLQSGEWLRSRRRWSMNELISVKAARRKLDRRAARAGVSLGCRPRRQQSLRSLRLLRWQNPQHGHGFHRAHGRHGIWPDKVRLASSGEVRRSGSHGLSSIPGARYQRGDGGDGADSSDHRSPILPHVWDLLQEPGAAGNEVQARPPQWQKMTATSEKRTAT